jgi:hypothetical protein
MHFPPLCIHWSGILRNLVNMAKIVYIFLKYFTNITSNGGAVSQSHRLKILRMLVRLRPVFFSLPSHGVPSVKLRILENFTLYLCNSWSLNLRSIENCICGLRSIGRKMRSILQTVYRQHLCRRQLIQEQSRSEQDWGYELKTSIVKRSLSLACSY